MGGETANDRAGHVILAVADPDRPPDPVQFLPWIEALDRRVHPEPPLVDLVADPFGERLDAGGADQGEVLRRSVVEPGLRAVADETEWRPFRVPVERIDFEARHEDFDRSGDSLAIRLEANVAGSDFVSVVAHDEPPRADVEPRVDEGQARRVLHREERVLAPPAGTLLVTRVVEQEAQHTVALDRSAGTQREAVRGGWGHALDGELIETGNRGQRRRSQFARSGW